MSHQSTELYVAEHLVEQKMLQVKLFELEKKPLMLDEKRKVMQENRVRR